MSKIPYRVLGALQRYQERRIDPGSFARAVLEDRLYDAVAYGDDECMEALKDIVRYVKSKLPITIYGSREAVREWLEQ